MGGVKGLAGKLVAGLLSVMLVVGLAPVPALAESSRFLAPASAASLVAQAGSSVNSATPISLNKVASGKLSSSSDEDWYKVTLPKAGKFQLRMSGSYSSYAAWEVSLRNSGNKELWDGYHSASAKSTKSLFVKSLKAGTYYIRVSRNWGDTDNLIYAITPNYYVPSTAISKLTAVKKAFTVKWTKKSGATKYQLRYSTNSNMKNCKSASISSKYSSKKISGLLAGKRYWVQVRVAKKIGSKIYYSPWSGKKAVMTKK